jgi:outer membrane immunogenic protein
MDGFSLPQTPAGKIGGVQAGYRFQRDWLVIGAETDFQWSGRKDSSCVDCFVTGLFYDDKLDWFGTVRGIAGVAQNDWLWYVTGGYAYGRIAVNVNTPMTGLAQHPIGPASPILASSRSTKGGWTVGAGVETRLWASNWSAKLEYLYMDLGDVSFDGYCTQATAALLGLQIGRCEAANTSITDHIVRVGLNYTFGARP